MAQILEEAPIEPRFERDFSSSENAMQVWAGLGLFGTLCFGLGLFSGSSFGNASTFGWAAFVAPAVVLVFVGILVGAAGGGYYALALLGAGALAFVLGIVFSVIPPTGWFTLGSLTGQGGFVWGNASGIVLVLMFGGAAVAAVAWGRALSLRRLYAESDDEETAEPSSM